MNVVLVETDIDNPMLEQVLVRCGMRVVKISGHTRWLSLVQDIRPDLLVFNLDAPTQELLTDLHLLNQSMPLPVIMFISDAQHGIISQVMAAEVSSLVVNGLDERRIDSIVQIAHARFKQQQALKQALEEARTQLDNRKQIDRAKAILIKTQQFSEHEAYHTLRKLAMDCNITLGEMAKNVIAMAELLK